MPPDTQFMLGGIDAKLDTLIRRTDEDRKSNEKLAARVTTLEEFRWKLLGAAAALGGISGLLTKVFTS